MKKPSSLLFGKKAFFFRLYRFGVTQEALEIQGALGLCILLCTNDSGEDGPGYGQCHK